MANYFPQRTQTLAFKNSNLLRWLMPIVVTLLTAMCAFLLFERTGDKAEINVQKSNYTQLDSVRLRLETAFAEANATANILRQQNGHLDTLLDGFQAELDRRKAMVEKLISEASVNDEAKSKLPQALAQIQQISALRDLLVQRVGNLQDENKQIAEQKNIATQKADELGAKVVETEEKVAQLETQRQALTEEKTQLEQKVVKAAALKVRNLKATGIYFKNGGREKEICKASKSEKMKVCFDVETNSNTDPGEELFIVRIVTLDGKTLSADIQGSSVFYEKETKGSMRYTTSVSLTYDATSKSACAYWQQPEGFAKGDYQVEVYNKGHLAGRSSITLR